MLRLLSTCMVKLVTRPDVVCVYTHTRLTICRLMRTCSRINLEDKNPSDTPLQWLLSFDPKEHPSAAEARVGEMHIYSLLRCILTIMNSHCSNGP
jgi:hypothetical protein